jgi:hypothetical protein
VSNNCIDWEIQSSYNLGNQIADLVEQVVSLVGVF